MARNRCSYEKRAKEIARKQKQEEKTKRRQNKLQAKTEEETFEAETSESGVIEMESLESAEE